MSVNFKYVDSKEQSMIKKSNGPRSYSFTYYSIKEKRYITTHNSYDLALYEVHIVRKAISKNIPIFFVGNEYDVELLKKFGVVGTNMSHFSCLKEQLTNVLKIFEGATVFVTREWLNDVELIDFPNINGKSYLLKKLFNMAKSVNLIDTNKNLIWLYKRANCVDEDFLRIFRDDIGYSIRITENNFSKNDTFIIN